HEADLRRSVVDDLYRRSATAVWFLAPSLFLFRAIVREGYDASPAVRAAFWTTLALVFVRWGVVLHHRRRPPVDAAAVRSLYLRFHVLTTLMGWGIAVTLVLADPYLRASQFALVCMFLTGVHAAALGSMGASPATYAQYTNPSLLALLFCLLRRPRT